jgi:hypothetical protein
MFTSKQASKVIAAMTLMVINIQPGLGAEKSSPEKAPRISSIHSGGVRLDQFSRVFDEAKRALEERRYDAARSFVRAALKESQGVGDRSKRSLEATLLLAKVENRSGQTQKAYNILRDMDREYGHAFGQKALQYAECLSELADAELGLYKYKLAEEHARKALEILEERTAGSAKPDSDSYDELFTERGRAASRVGQALSAQGFHDEAKTYFQGSQNWLKQAPGFKDLDLADELRQEAIFLRNVGDKKAGNELFEKASEMYDRAGNAEQPSHVLGSVAMRWEYGSPRSHEIIDNDFPLRYITTDKIRVAATTIDLWELMAVMVCVTNLDNHKRTIGFGDVNLYRLETDAKSGQVKQVFHIPEVNHHTIDRTRRELGIWTLTQNRPWLANMQKDRNMRGLVPSEGHDLFRGPNMFGVWREWGGQSHVLPMRVSVEPSRENVYDEGAEGSPRETGLIRAESSNINKAGLQSIILEPFESRTGELFYIYPRGEDTVKVKVEIGNMDFEFPFQCRKHRIK